MRRRWGTGLFTALAVATTVIAAGSSLTPVSAAPKAPPKPQWAGCAGAAPAPYECATIRTPMDYNDPGGDQVSLALIRLRATDQKARIGSLFVNFGGPGADGIKSLPKWAAKVFPAEIRRQFDLVSFDPRGIGRSSAVRCFQTAKEKDAYFDAVPAFPAANATAESQFYAQAEKLSQACARNAGPILSHVSSANVARDLEVMRQSVGDRALTYVGFSYGTVIGATYANLFPERVRSIVLDGTLDMIGNATGHGDTGRTTPIGTRQGVQDGSQDTLNIFFAQCARAGKACPYAAGGDLAGRWRAILAQAKPLTVQIGGKAVTYDYASLSGKVWSDLSAPMEDWENLGVLLAALDKARTQPATSRSAAVTRTPTAAAGESYLDNSESYPAIQCIDAPTPKKLARYTELGASEDRRVPAFGRMQVFDPMSCPTWPAVDHDRYRGPWNRTIKPLLVMNAAYDPSTPYAGAKRAVGQLGKAHLVTVEGAGHTAMFRSRSSCAERTQTTYLLTGQYPATPETRCPVDELPWKLPPGR